MSKRFGIDLGATYSSIALYDPDRRRVEFAHLGAAEGGCRLRSLVYFPEGADPVVGEAAIKASACHPDRVIIGVKRAMGEAWRTVPIDGKEYTCTDVAAEILRALKADGEVYFGEPIQDVVITVPAYFGPDQRRDTAEAAEMAGLRVMRLLDEPSAAAMAFAIDEIDKTAGHNILVYDLGGGTFDVTLIHCEREEYEPGVIGLKVRTICKNGDRRLGGMDWDRELEKIVAESCLEQFQHDPRLDAADNATLTEQCEKHKRHLSRIDSVLIPADMRGHQVEVSRSEFLEKTAYLISRTRVLLEQVLNTVENPDEELRKQFPDALPLTRDQIEVLLCGGATKMPAVEAMIEEVMGKPPLKHVNPELLVAMGAAYFAYLLSPHLTKEAQERTEAGEEPPEESYVTTYDERGEEAKAYLRKDTGILVRPVGVEVLKDPDHPELGTMNSVVIPSGAAVGEIHRVDFAAAFDGQTELEIVLLEGDDPDPANCARLDSLVLRSIRPGRPKGWKICVELKYDESGLIVGSAWDVELGEEIGIEYRRPLEPRPEDRGERLAEESEWKILSRFRALGLAVTDDFAKIQARIEQLWANRRREATSTDPALRAEAQEWFSIVESLRNPDKVAGYVATLQAVFWRTVADMPLVAAKDLTRIAREQFGFDDDLAQRTVAPQRAPCGASLVSCLQTRVGPGVVRLRWDLPKQRCDEIIVLRRQADEEKEWTVLFRGGLREGYEDRTVTPGSRYAYQVYSVFRGVASADSVAAEVAVPGEGAPAGAKCTGCGRDLPAGAQYCFSCGLQVSTLAGTRDYAAGRTPRRGERVVPGRVDRVHFTITSPPTVLPGAVFVIGVWAHLERQRKQVIERALEAARAATGEILVTSKGPVGVARGTVLSVRLDVDGLTIPYAEDEILWEGEIGNATFSVRVPDEVPEGPKPGVATIFADGLQIARVCFLIHVGKALAEVTDVPVEEERHRKAFACYASQDRDGVMARVQGIQKAAPDMEIFVDVDSLRSGQYWEQELWKVIPSKDIFYLFWSLRASQSEWVQKEWRCALATRGLDFIDPVPLASPEHVPPPAELAARHFNDKWLAYMRGRGGKG